MRESDVEEEERGERGGEEVKVDFASSALGESCPTGLEGGWAAFHCWKRSRERRNACLSSFLAFLVVLICQTHAYLHCETATLALLGREIGS